MPDQPAKMTDCPKCHRAVAADAWQCLYCGEPMPGKSPPKPAAPVSDPAAVMTRVLIDELKGVCPKCQTGHDRQPLHVETWEYTGASWTGKRRYFNVRNGIIPGYCPTCSKRLELRRWLAVALFALPLLFAAYGSVAWGPGFLVIVSLVYGVHFLKNIGYSWVDRLVYGLDLEFHLAGPISQFQSPSGDAWVLFPVGCLHSLLRLVFVVFLCGVSAVAGDLLKGPPAAKARSPFQPPTMGESLRQQPEIRDLPGLLRIIQGGDASQTLAILAVHPELAFARGNKQVTALHYAVKLDNPALIEDLLKRGAQIEAMDAGNHFTPLHWAALNGNLVSIDTLLKKGAKIDARGKNGHTPLHIAILNIKPDAARFLIEQGADVNARVPQGSTCLRFSRLKGLHEISVLLQKKGGQD